MAGSGVSGGTAMLRTRRRDVSIKPNRRLDRKSSRGMIYENEELRLRTININAEVEQGQNDIKKLRRENEQLRREIWSLRDEYDKLEELVKNQSSHGSSDELEGRSGEEENVDDVYTEYSGDDDILDDEEEEEEYRDEEGAEEEEEEITENGDKSQEEYLENEENQKISSEKMSTSLHRLHVEFDDLSIVDEEEELQKKDKDKRDLILLTDDGITGEKMNSNKTINERNYPYFTSPSEEKYLNDSTFVFPNPSDPNYPKMLPLDNTNIYNGQLTPLPSLDTPDIGPVDTIFGQNEFQQIPTPFNFRDNFNETTTPNLPQRRNITFKQSVNLFDDTLYKINSTNNTDTPNSGDVVTNDGWDFSKAFHNSNGNDVTSINNSNDKPKHFFAPLQYKLRGQKSNEETFTATSSSSDKTNSTVVSRNNNNNSNNNNNHLVGKGTADVYVNGGFPFGDYNNRADILTTSNNHLVEEFKNMSIQGSSNHLIKSLSCQDLSSSDPQSLPFVEKLKLFNNSNNGITKSDNTLDNISINSRSCSSTNRPFKSQLNVTLKLPKINVPSSSSNTPEIPKLPVINYKFFNNPFLQSYNDDNDKISNFNLESHVTRPLSIQVNDDQRNSIVNGNKSFQFKSKIEDPCLLLMAANQYRNLEEMNNYQRRNNIGFEMTSFEGPCPKTLISSHVNPSVIKNQRLFQGVDNNGDSVYPANSITANKVQAQTQTSLDLDSRQFEDKNFELKDTVVNPGSPLTMRRKRTIRKDRSGSIKDNKRPLSPAAQRRKERLRKQNSVTSTEPLESPVKTPQRSRKFSFTTSTSTAADVNEKNESRSSSSGQDSPKKNEQKRRVSIYFNAKKRPSIVSNNKIDRRSSVDNIKERRYSSSVRNDHQDATTTNSERERTNSVSSRDTVTKGRKMSTGSGKVPWCACWGNGCV